MTQATLAALRMTVLMGCGLGALYGFLRPLRPALTALADGIFVLCCATCWVYLCFGVCAGDIRLGYVVGAMLCAVGWEATLGRLLNPVFRLFWLPLKKLLHFSAKI